MNKWNDSKQHNLIDLLKFHLFINFAKHCSPFYVPAVDIAGNVSPDGVIDLYWMLDWKYIVRTVYRKRNHTKITIHIHIKTLWKKFNDTNIATNCWLLKFGTKFNKFVGILLSCLYKNVIEKSNMKVHKNIEFASHY